jgi:hypothetical protein
MRDRAHDATLDVMTKNQPAGQEAPMVISPRDVARLLRQIFTTLRRKRT